MCGHQGGPVWFLSDQLEGREERTCNIPTGKAILIPLPTGECGYDDEDLRNYGGYCLCPTWSVNLDGVIAVLVVEQLSYAIIRIESIFI